MNEPKDRLDTRGLRCPLPVLRLEAVLRKMKPGQMVEVWADDPIAALDIPHAAREGGHQWVKLPSPEPGLCVFQVTRGGEG